MARRRIRELETELGIVRQAAKFLGLARQNDSKKKRTPTIGTQLRRQWLTGLIREIHVASRGTYRYRRVHAELTMGMASPCASALCGGW